MIGNFKDVAETLLNRFAESPLGKQLESMVLDYSNDDCDQSLYDYAETEENIEDGSEEGDSGLNDLDDDRIIDVANGEAISDDLVPNATYKLGEITYKTDDKGNVYCIDDKLKPDVTYMLNGNIYKTDEKGRIVDCYAKPSLNPENFRDNEDQRQVGGDDRREGDQGGHIVGRDMNGDGGIGNLLAMDSKINQSDYKRMENDIKTALYEGKEVTTRTEISYSGDSQRPDRITVTVTADGKDTVYKFDNNLDGSLRGEVPENGKEIVQSRLDETGGEISSVKEEYNENGNLVETTIYITYKGEDGNNYRTSVLVENYGGGALE